MFSNLDLGRSYRQYEHHRKIGYLKLSLFHKILLSILFFLLIPFFILSFIFKKCNKRSNVAFIMYTPKDQPYKTINNFLRSMNVDFIKIKKLYLPIVPIIFIQDVIKELLNSPWSVIKNLPFLGGLLIQISKYYFFIKFNKISKLVVMQEYSFYMTYLTRVLEYEGGKLYNIQHGIPGETYCHFRFSKCFVWSEYFKEQYVKLGADEKQFIIAGSIYHKAILQNNFKKDYCSPVEILYMMQGAHKKHKDVLEVLEQLSFDYKTGIRQHPRHKIVTNAHINELDEDTVDCIENTNIVISHYSTALLDAAVLGRIAISYLDKDSIERKYVSFLNKQYIVDNKDDLRNLILKSIKLENKNNLMEKKFIDTDTDIKKVLLDEIYEGSK